MRTRSVIGGFAAGAAVMYFADRQRGRRRRTVARDQSAAMLRQVNTEFQKAGRDAVNRAKGLAHRLQFWKPGAAEGIVLEERIRSIIGRAISHPHGVHVRIDPRGSVVLSGPVLASELDSLLNRVCSVPGVLEVVNRLEVHRTPEGVPVLQGGSPRRPRNVLERERWPPALRVGASMLGSAALASGLRRQGPVGWGTAAVGAALLGRAVVNKSLVAALGADSGAGAIQVDKTIHIGAPVDAVYRFWSDVENFPRFMSHLKEVRDLGNGRSRWVAHGPAGVPVVWEAEAAQEPNRAFTWRSVPGSVVKTAGEVRFHAEDEGHTRLEVHMTYTPPAGVVGHAVASLFGVDPKTEITDDLVRLKSLLEIGRTRVHGHRVLAGEMQGSGAIRS